MHDLFFQWMLRIFGKGRNKNAEKSKGAFEFSILSLVCSWWNLPRLVGDWLVTMIEAEV
jgi:hypothetical protein